jgi:hypothetical protein
LGAQFDIASADLPRQVSDERGHPNHSFGPDSGGAAATCRQRPGSGQAQGRSLALRGLVGVIAIRSSVRVHEGTAGAHAVLIRDGAGWQQTGGRQGVPVNITLRPPPPYVLELNSPELNSPELNSIENVPEYLRGNKLSRLVWDTHDAIIIAWEKARNFFINDPDRIGSIGYRERVSVNVQASWH